MPLVNYIPPVDQVAGNIHGPHGSPGLTCWLNPNAGLIAGPTVPLTNARTPLEQNIMDIHKLVGPLHNESGLTPGHFLKATSPAIFAFGAHGLLAADVGAAEAVHVHSALVAPDGSPNPALDVDNAGIAAIHSPNASQSLSLKHDNSNAYISQSAGSLTLQNAASETYQQLILTGTGSTSAAYAVLRTNDRSVNPTYTMSGCYAGAGYIYTTGAAPAAFRLEHPGNVGISCFDAATSSKTPAFSVSGYRAGDAKRTLSLAVGSEAADTASISGLTTYKFTGSINATANLQTAGTTRIDATGAATLGAVTAGNITSTGYNVSRFRGFLTTEPVTDLRDGDMYYDVPSLKLMIYNATGETWVTTYAP